MKIFTLTENFPSFMDFINNDVKFGGPSTILEFPPGPLGGRSVKLISY